MTTARLDARVLLVSQTSETDPSKLDRVDDNLSYGDSFDGLARLLASGDDGEESAKGFLYVPSIDFEDRCLNSSSKFPVPQNVSRLTDFPQSGFDLIALAPWASPNCTLTYLEAAKADSASGFIFYKPGGSHQLPPPASDSRWNLSDAGAWRGNFSFPVYAIPEYVGSKLINKTAEYSGKLSDAELGSELVQRYGNDDLPRLSISIESENHSNSLPNLWIFLIGVLGALLVVVVSSSVAMRWVQRRRRQALARRLATGEVDLESIGIKKFKVPQSVLNKMPLYIYTETSAAPVGEKPSDTTTQSNGSEARPAASERHRAQYGAVDTSANGFGTPYSTSSSPERKHLTSHGQRASLPENSLMFSQSTCPICLSDYVPLSTNVRELPCGHIFHPECIDTFLVQTSSLCPICKQSALPPGFCPEEITNSMVYRERMSRARERHRNRPRPTPIPTRSDVHATPRGYVRPVRSPPPGASVGNPTPDNNYQPIFSRLRFWGRSNAETDTPQADDDIPPGNNPHPSDQAEDHDGDTTHEERMRRRAVAMLGPDHAEEDIDREEDSISRWRRAWNKYFPGFR